MVLQISPAQESDIDQFMLIQFAAFDYEIYHAKLYPGGNTPPARAAAAARVLKEWRESPHQHTIKCTDSKTGQLLGFATWEFYEKERPEEEWKQAVVVDWCDGEDKRVAEVFLGATYGNRWKLWEGRPHICEWITLRQSFVSSPSCLFFYASIWPICCIDRRLNWYRLNQTSTVCAIVAVHPDHQRKGAGTLLIQWGLDHAQKVGLPAYLEASVYGYPLYLKLGFHDFAQVVIKAEDWGGEADKVYTAMLKEPALSTT
jgi:GNAT superfamily N-acetyltransferase